MIDDKKFKAALKEVNREWDKKAQEELMDSLPMKRMQMKAAAMFAVFLFLMSFGIIVAKDWDWLPINLLLWALYVYNFGSEFWKDLIRRPTKYNGGYTKYEASLRNNVIDVRQPKDNYK